jgi:hypothetical protein
MNKESKEILKYLKLRWEMGRPAHGEVVICEGRKGGKGERNDWQTRHGD